MEIGNCDDMRCQLGSWVSKWGLWHEHHAWAHLTFPCPFDMPKLHMQNTTKLYTTRSHNIIQIHNSVVWDWQYYVVYSSHSAWMVEYSTKYCQSHGTLLWIWIMLCKCGIYIKFGYIFGSCYVVTLLDWTHVFEWYMTNL